MSKKKILLLVPLGIISGFLSHTWLTFLFTEIQATWRHYLGIVLFTTLIFLLFKSFKKAVLATGIFLILGTCNLLTLTPSVISNSYGVKIGSLEMETPPFQLLSFGILLLFFFINFDTLVDINLDYKDAKQSKRKE